MKDERSRNSDLPWRRLAALRESRIDLERGKQLFASKIDRERQITNQRVGSPWTASRSVLLPAVFALMAVLILIVGATRHLYTTGSPTHGLMTTYVTHRGQRAEITLADGTKVTLNVASRIEVPEQFSHSDRTVRLVGEADFQVNHHTTSPLIVETGSTQTRVLGTEFSVRAYQPDRVRVVVRSGKVAVNDTVLGAQDIAHVTPLGRIDIARKQNVDVLFGFMMGRLTFINTPLVDAIPDLDRWYDVDIRLGDLALRTLPLDAVLTNGSIGDLSEILQVTFDVRVVQLGRTLTLYPR